MRPPVPTWPAGGGFGFRSADSTRYGAVALTVLNVPMVSISITDLKPLGDRPDMGATKLPAAPALDAEDSQYAEVYHSGMITCGGQT